MEEDEEFGGDVEMMEALSAAAKEVGFSFEADDDDGGLNDPIEGLEQSKSISESDFRSGKLVEESRGGDKKEASDEEEPEPLAASDDDDPEESGREGEDEGGEKGAQTSIDWSGLGVGADVASALSALPAEKVAPIAGRLNMVAALDQIREDYKDFYASRGVDLKQEDIPAYVSQLVRMDYMASTRPKDYVDYVVDQLGVDFSEIAKARGYQKSASASRDDEDDENWDPFADDDDEERNDPPPAKAAATKDQPARRIDPRIRTEVEQRAAQRRSAEMLQAFAEEKDAVGALLRPHFEALAPQMAIMAQAEIAKTGNSIDRAGLDRLYKAAVLQSDLGESERAKMAAELLKKDGAEKARAGQDRVNRARRASRQAAPPAPRARPSGASPDDSTDIDFMKSYAKERGIEF